MDEATLESEIERLAALFTQRSGLTLENLPARGRQGDGPYYYVEGEVAVLEHRERGAVNHSRATTSADELLWWVFDGAVSMAAFARERTTARSGADPRRAWFPQWVELMGLLEPSWADRTRRHIAELLEIAPFHDH